ncbi:hypothetical protein GF336_05855 [Candidatus Woesearchaeota archaeon]|nr:hypothetical protein [Candidatus Woesearchaeota archaeon]
MVKIAPLKPSLMVVSILGFIVSAFLVNNLDWKITLLIFFAVMFIASFISMHYSSVIPKK